MFGCTDAHFFKTYVVIVTVTSIAYLIALRFKYKIKKLNTSYVIKRKILILIALTKLIFFLKCWLDYPSINFDY